MQREEMKTQRKQTSKEQQETEKRRQFDLKQQKRKAGGAGYLPHQYDETAGLPTGSGTPH